MEYQPGLKLGQIKVKHTIGNAVQETRVKSKIVMHVVQTVLTNALIVSSIGRDSFQSKLLPRDCMSDRKQQQER